MNLADVFEYYIGAKEWDSTVEEIQTWYYGSFVKDSWCATSLSFMSSLIGYDTSTEPLVEDWTSFLELIGGKNANVYNMMQDCMTHATPDVSEFYYRDYIPEDTLLAGDIIFWLWQGNNMGVNSKKHVGVCYEDVDISVDNPIIKCIGGNQSNQIKIAQTSANYYKKNQIYAIYRILEGGEWLEEQPDPPQPTPDPPEPSPSPEGKDTSKFIYYLKPQWRRI